MTDRPRPPTVNPPTCRARWPLPPSTVGGIVVVAGAVFVIAWVLTQLYVMVVPLVLSLFIARCFLDEMERRDPAGFSNWLHADAP